jgi:phosphoribosylaminoimidazole-succinocarboxamide synthase
MMGLIIAASDCPHTVFLKPMARFHLPFSDEVETIYRATSMYLLAQYFKKKEKGKADFTLIELMDMYDQLHIINTAIASRLRIAGETDSTVNAIVLLDIFTKTLPKAIDESLREIQYLFKPFFKKKGK